MRVVTDAGDAASAMESAQREALSSFGHAEVYVERYLTWPRHIEMQVFADSHRQRGVAGRAGLLVPTPSPKAHRREPRARLRETSSAGPWARPRSASARACGYEGAGTVEFLYEDGSFYFLEMNTRLQVEHPVTEMLTRARPCRVAAARRGRRAAPAVAGRARLTEPGARHRGTDQRRGPVRRQVPPQPRKDHQAPSSGGIRGAGRTRDSSPGDTVSQYYDNLVAKIVVWGHDRDAARRRLLRAVSEMEVEGVATTRSR